LECDEVSDAADVDLNALVQRAQAMRRRLERAQEDLSRIEAEGHGGGGLVRAVVTGENQLVALSIDSSVIDPDDPETLSELVREAVNDASRAVLLKRNERVSGITEGFAAGLPAPTRPGPRVQPLPASRLHELRRQQEQQQSGEAQQQALQGMQDQQGPHGQRGQQT
jgi:DNA-binding YbaB/EbfC family protein